MVFRVQFAHAYNAQIGKVRSFDESTRMCLTVKVRHNQVIFDHRPKPTEPTQGETQPPRAQHRRSTAVQ